MGDVALQLQGKPDSFLNTRRNLGDITNQDDHEDQYYKKSGLMSRIAKAPRFKNTTLAVIVLNSIYMSFETELAQEHAAPWEDHAVIAVFSIGFSVYYILELA